MMSRGRILVNMVEGRDKENVTPPPVVHAHNETLEPTVEVVGEPIPSTSKQQEHGPFYYISPIHSDESVIDDSDTDPTFRVVPKGKTLPKVVPSSSNSSSTNTSSSSSSSGDSSSSSDNSSDTENGTEHEDPQRVVAAEIINQDPVIEKRSKKRVRKPANWKFKVAKVLRNSGKAYQSSSKSKKEVPERKVGPPCGEKCRLKCKDKINEMARQQLFRAYWGLGNLERQREFIVRHSQEIKPKYRYSSTQNVRALNTAFYFEVDGSKIRVCKLFFKSTLDLSNKAIKTAFSKKTETGVILADLRGKHDHHPTIDPQVKQSVIDFINAIPRVESHYLRAQTTREYISSDKSLADIYRDYKRLREEDGLPFATSSTFNRIFNTEFNISFFTPKKDLCDQCERYKNSDEEEKRKLHQEYEQHIEEKTLARTEKEKDKNRTDGTITAVYDLQAVLQIPKGQVSLFFYKSRINCLNFTISDLRAKDVICYFWDETEAKRGAVEIGSCILNYIKSQVDQNPNKELDIIFYSDNCGGQQKNKYLLSVYAYAVNKLPVKSITHKFLIRGHSQNEGDNVHSVIEKQIKRYLQSGPIYIPEQYKTLIGTAKKTGKPYTVIEMTHNMFYDVKVLQESWGTNFNIDEDKNQIKWHEIKILRVEKEHPEEFFYKTSFAEEAFRKTCVRKRVLRARGTGTATDQTIFSIGLTQAYTEKIALSDAKKKDIKELIDKNVIPKSYYEVYYKGVLGDLGDTMDYKILRHAMTSIEISTCVVFQEVKTDGVLEAKSQIWFSKDGNEMPMLGFVENKQTVKLSSFVNGAAGHDAHVYNNLLRILGVHMMSNRFDRDNYVTINWRNVEKGKEQYLERAPEEAWLSQIPYDFDSITHAPANYMCGDCGLGATTVQPIQDYLWQRTISMGHSKDLSKYDIQIINMLYVTQCRKRLFDV